MDFSSTIRIADFNDYIAPSQECVVALNGKIKPEEVLLLWGLSGSLRRRAS